jgi:triosephosphate isomerase
MIRAMRPVIVAGNWKMHTTPSDAGELAATIARRTNEPEVVRVLCPPYVCLGAVREALAAEPAGRDVAVGAQSVHHEVTGAFTGEVSAPMVRELATWAIVGHSERRRDAAETDALINRKVQRALEAGLRVILCVGEQLDDREAGRAEAIVEAQVRGCLADLPAGAVEAAAAAAGVAAGPAASGSTGGRAGKAGWLTIAYEPVWAIGTGRTARGADAARMADVIRRTLAELGFSAAGETVPVLYGGSVTAASIDEFMAEPAIDGALVGGASLKPDEMAAIVARAGLTARARATASS